MIKNAHIIGFPSLYGGAGAELYHQIPVWEKLGVKLHFIPTQKNVKGAALYYDMLERGHVIHEAYDWNAIPENAPVISFCNEDFLATLPEIRQRTRSTLNALWFTHWDPTQPIATRPLSIRKNATWYTYGHDLTKNVTELYKTDGTIATAYDYTPYGAVTAAGPDQPFQWSSEVYDAELGMVYYNYRHYNPMDGRWIGRDILKNEILLNILLSTRMNLNFHILNFYYLQKNLYKMIDNNTARNFDAFGNRTFTQEELDRIIKQLRETEKALQDCLDKHRGGGKFKINPRLAFPPEEQAKSPNCLGHALGCPFPLGADYEDSIKELNKDCQEVPVGPCQQGQHQVLLYGLQTPPGNYHVVRGNDDGSWSAAVGGTGIITDITDPEKNTKAWYEDCVKENGMDPQKIDQSKTKRYCCCDRK